MRAPSAGRAPSARGALRPPGWPSRPSRNLSGQESSTRLDGAVLASPSVRCGLELGDVSAELLGLTPRMPLRFLALVDRGIRLQSGLASPPPAPRRPSARFVRSADSHLSRSFVQLSTNAPSYLPWLGDVPPHCLTVLRHELSEGLRVIFDFGRVCRFHRRVLKSSPRGRGLSVHPQKCYLLPLVSWPDGRGLDPERGTCFRLSRVAPR